MNKNYKKVLLIDLDGVLNNYNGKFDANFIPDIKNGAYEFLQKLSKEKYIKRLCNSFIPSPEKGGNVLILSISPLALP